MKSITLNTPKIKQLSIKRAFGELMYSWFLPLIKRWNRIEFYFVKPLSIEKRKALLAEIEAVRMDNAMLENSKYEALHKRFGKTKIYYTDNEVRVFRLPSWVAMGEDILKLNNIKIKRCGRN